MKNKEVVQQVIEAFLSVDVDKALSYMADDVKIGWPGYFDLAPGKAAVRDFFKDIPEIVSGELIDLIADGNKVAGTGMVTAKHADGSLKNSFFCDVYTLENEKVVELKSYMVFEEKKEKA